MKSNAKESNTYKNSLLSSKRQRTTQNNTSNLTSLERTSKVKFDDDEEIFKKDQDPNLLALSNENMIDLNELVNLEIITGKNKITIADSGTTLPVLLKLKVGAHKSERQTSTDLICVIDKSGSMHGSKLDLLKKTFDYMMEFLTEEDRLSIVTFNYNAERLTPLIRMTESGKADTLAKINSITSSGGTSIAEGVNLALNIIAHKRYTNNVTSILILSDGLDSGALNKIKLLLNGYESKIKDQFTFNTFGYGEDHDPLLMTEISKLKKGSFYYINKLDQVDECFADCLGGLFSIVAQDVKISITPNLDNGIKIVKAFGEEGFWSLNNKDSSYNANLGQLISEKELDYIFEIKLPELTNMNNFSLLSATCSMTGLKESEFQKCEKFSESIVDITNEYSDVEFNTIVLVHYYRLKTAEVTNQARILIERNCHQDAKGLLSSLKEEVINSKVKDDPMIQGLITELDNTMDQAKPESFRKHGRKLMMEKVRANYNQQSNLNGAIQYQNRKQKAMISIVRSKKDCTADLNFFLK